MSIESAKGFTIQLPSKAPIPTPTISGPYLYELGDGTLEHTADKLRETA
jgi:hypothetical protein